MTGGVHSMDGTGAGMCAKMDSNMDGRLCWDAYQELELESIGCGKETAERC